MHILTIPTIDKRGASDALAIAFFKDHLEQPDLAALENIILAPIRAGDFAAKEGEIVTVWGSEPQEKRIFLLGLGPKEKCSLETLRKSYASLARSCLKAKCKSLNLVLPQVDTLGREVSLKAILEGLYLAGYVFDKLKSDIPEDERVQPLEEITLIGPELHLIAKEASRTQKVMHAVWQARDLINGNADDTNPQFLAEFAKELSQEFPRIKTEVKERAWIEQEKMGLLLAVSRGASVDPTFIICSYQGQPVSSDHTVIVGKGVTYDTGGLALKTVEGMLPMRCDMSGAAVALATIQALAALNMPVNVTCVVPCCENAISARAYKLGDVYTSRAGITVEVTNTDAEGRLIMADAISYAVDVLKPSRILDIGTLTGSMEVALGNELMGLFSNSDSLLADLFNAGQRTHERGWRMPLYEEYKEQLRSDIADIKNAATRKGGSILCAMFLQQFVKNVPWVHCDIAPVAFNKEARSYWPKNATGIGVRLFVDYFEHLVR